ncbi:TVP38/TMEM64 family protein [Sulfoacidibacillus thermotolerans]|uniref:TVP38/TMEM64 family membrane protein n=1 Tax=Sulfoacidibacillus thermotolerans TaxID=1765684 RepID=A0A2U3DAT9_SULT2|nr:VTT domain-containing protein [Sulfoacidibacillus thermotolerans]PWI58398.1 hypothetical protein BM613_04080 [Sulfoacidibacillus thermotolerans]
MRTKNAQVQHLQWKQKITQSWIMYALAGMTFLAVAIFFYLDERGEMTAMIRSYGLMGVIIAVFLMGAICMTPIPSEGLLLIFLKVYGVLYGLLFAWIGSTLGAISIFFLARFVIQPVVISMITEERLQQIDHFIRKRGTSGLLIARLLPIPAVLVNYAAGILPAVRFSGYLWTAVVSLLPYYMGTVFLFLGIMSGLDHWLLIGGVIILLLIGTSYFFNQKEKS